MHFTSAPPAVATVGPVCERGDKTVFYGYQKSSRAHALTSITQLSPLLRGPKHLKHSVQVFSIVP